MKPTTTAEADAMATFLGWLSSFTDWAHEGEAKRKAGQAWCEQREASE